MPRFPRVPREPSSGPAGKPRSRHHAQRPLKPRPSATAGPADALGIDAANPESPPASVHPKLQKVLASAGFGSRRQCETLITAGRVQVDGRVATELGQRVDPERQEIRVDTQVLKLSTRKVYFAVNKPTGVVTTSHDPAGRPRVIDLVDAADQRVFAVGRLDLSSEGLILVTNDGELAHRLTHPRFGVEKTYEVLVAGIPTRDEVAKLLHGIHLAEGVARASHVHFKARYKQSALLEIVLREGRNREIRRILARLGHKVMRLKRIAFGPLRLASLPSGAARRLAHEEVRQLEAATHGAGRARRSRPPRPAPGKPRDGRPPSGAPLAPTAPTTAGTRAQSTGAVAARPPAPRPPAPGKSGRARRTIGGDQPSAPTRRPPRTAGGASRGQAGGRPPRKPRPGGRR